MSPHQMSLHFLIKLKDLRKRVIGTRRPHLCLLHTGPWRRARGRIIRIASLIHSSAECLANDVVGSTRWISWSTILAITRDVRYHQPGISLQDGLIIEPPSRGPYPRRTCRTD